MRITDNIDKVTPPFFVKFFFFFHHFVFWYFGTIISSTNNEISISLQFIRGKGELEL